MHPADEIRATTSKLLRGKRIALGITGSIAAVECIKLARELIRHGAEVIPVMTEYAQHIIHPDSIHFATGKPAITQLTGATEHVTYCGMNKNPVDLLLICPCTANTISKIACGIDDTPVTTFATTAIGSNIPIAIVPAMHLSMYRHPIIQHHIETLRGIGIQFIDPTLTTTKAKMPDGPRIIEEVLRMLGPQDLKNQRILIIGGATSEPIDDIRILTNTSSGTLANHLGQVAYRRGADVDLWMGNHTHITPNHLSFTSFSSHQDLENLITTSKNTYNAIINCAAIADYTTTRKKGKIASQQDELIMKLTPTKKLLPLLKKHYPDARIIGFKAEPKTSILIDKGTHLLHENKLHAVICNTTEAFNSEDTTITILASNQSQQQFTGSKKDLANHILDILL